MTTSSFLTSPRVFLRLEAMANDTGWAARLARYKGPELRRSVWQLASSGNHEHRGFGDIDTLTVDEYLALSRWGRFKYRVYRHPVVLFGVGAILHFFVRHRLPTIVPREWTRERRSILWTDVGLAA